VLPKGITVASTTVIELEIKSEGKPGRSRAEILPTASGGKSAFGHLVYYDLAGEGGAGAAARRWRRSSIEE